MAVYNDIFSHQVNRKCKKYSIKISHYCYNIVALFSLFHMRHLTFVLLMLLSIVSLGISREIAATSTDTTTYLNQVDQTASSLSSTEKATYYQRLLSEIQAIITYNTTIREALKIRIASSFSGWMSPTPSNSHWTGIPVLWGNGCIISLWKSTCSANIYLKAPTRNIYILKNTTRNNTGSTYLTPRDYVFLSGSTYWQYVKSNTGVISSGNAGNDLTYGVNNLGVFNMSGASIARVSLSARCEEDTVWSGNACTRISTSLDATGSIFRTPTEYTGAIIGFRATSCTIPIWWSKCVSTLYVLAPRFRTFSVTNKTRNITTTHLIIPNDYQILSGSIYLVYKVWAKLDAFPDAANHLTRGINTLSLQDTSGSMVWEKTVGAVCIAGSVWNGNICAVPTQSTTGSIPPPSSISTLSGTLSLVCTKDVYSVWESVDCTLSGGALPVQQSLCWQETGGASTTPVLCSNTWIFTGGVLRYTQVVNEHMVGNYRLFAKNGDQTMSRYLVYRNSLAFRVLSYVTARGEFAFSGKIAFDPILDRTLTLRWIGPYGSVRMYMEGRPEWIISNYSSNLSGEWNLNNLSVEGFLKSGNFSYYIWDGKNRDTQIIIPINNTSLRTSTTSSSTSSGWASCSDCGIATELVTSRSLLY